MRTDLNPEHNEQLKGMGTYLKRLGILTVLFVVAIVLSHPLSKMIKHHREAQMKEHEPTPQERAELIKKMQMKCINEKDIHPETDPEGAELFKHARNIRKKVIMGTDEQMVELLTKAVERKYWRAYDELAELYLYGIGTPRDARKAIELLHEGMKQNIGRCYALMGNMLSTGNGVSQDTLAAFAYQRKAAELGFSPSMAVIGNKMIEVGADEPGLKILQCAADQGNPMAAYDIGMRYSFPEDHDFDQQKALRYLQRATELGHTGAALRLWGIFENGDMNMTKDPERAKRYDKLNDYLDPLNPMGDYPTILNLNAIVPLPPAPLPKWDGTIERSPK